MVTLFHYVDGVNGSLISIIDYYETMKRMGFSVKLCLLTDDAILGKTINSLYKSHNLQTYINGIQLTDRVEDECLICSSAFFFKKHGIKISYDRLVVLDSLELLRCNALGLPRERSLPKDGVYLCNPSTVIDGYDCREYYHKIDFSRSVKLRNPLHYRRSSKRNIYYGGVYLENIGKTIFEHLYSGCDVHYYPDGKCVDDGLTHYLKLVGVEDDSRDQIIRDVDVSCLALKDDDLVLKLVGLA